MQEDEKNTYQVVTDSIANEDHFLLEFPILIMLRTNLPVKVQHLLKRLALGGEHILNNRH